MRTFKDYINESAKDITTKDGCLYVGIDSSLSKSLYDRQVKSLTSLFEKNGFKFVGKDNKSFSERTNPAVITPMGGKGSVFFLFKNEEKGLSIELSTNTKSSDDGTDFWTVTFAGVYKNSGARMNFIDALFEFNMWTNKYVVYSGPKPSISKINYGLIQKHLPKIYSEQLIKAETKLKKIVSKF